MTTGTLDAQGHDTTLPDPAALTRDRQQLARDLTEAREAWTRLRPDDPRDSLARPLVADRIVKLERDLATVTAAIATATRRRHAFVQLSQAATLAGQRVEALFEDAIFRPPRTHDARVQLLRTLFTADGQYRRVMLKLAQHAPDVREPLDVGTRLERVLDERVGEVLQARAPQTIRVDDDLLTLFRQLDGEER